MVEFIGDTVVTKKHRMCFQACSGWEEKYQMMSDRHAVSSEVPWTILI